MRKAFQIESFMEWPKKKRPPKDIWDNNEELNIWFENIEEGRPNVGTFFIRDEDIEG